MTRRVVACVHNLLGSFIIKDSFRSSLFHAMQSHNGCNNITFMNDSAFLCDTLE